MDHMAGQSVGLGVILLSLAAIVCPGTIDNDRNRAIATLTTAVEQFAKSTSDSTSSSNDQFRGEQHVSHFGSMGSDSGGGTGFLGQQHGGRGIPRQQRVVQRSLKPSYHSKGFKRLVGNFRRINQTLAIEYMTHEETLKEESNARRNIKSFSDLIEGSPGAAVMTPLSEQYGLIALGQSDVSST